VATRQRLARFAQARDFFAGEKRLAVGPINLPLRQSAASRIDKDSAALHRFARSGNFARPTARYTFARNAF
jgi:hypothetical protein